MTNWAEVDASRKRRGIGGRASKDHQVVAAVKKLGHDATVRGVSERLNWSEKSVCDAVDRLRMAGYSIELSGSGGEVIAGAPQVKAEPIRHLLKDYQREWAIFGAVGDNHLGNRHERLDVLHALYDVFESEGITRVYNTGNWIDGEARFNRHELTVFGMDNQLDYWVKNYPTRKGITTYYVAGDDHEGWYQQREVVEIGLYAELRAKKAGRKDLIYLGYIERDVLLGVQGRTLQMKVIHPGGGSAYALSYKGQKFAESLQGGEKPNIVIQGHYHKFNVGYPREVWVVDTGTTCDQTGFMRKKGLQAMVGGCIVGVHRDPRGGINRFRTEFLPFYDRGFYGEKRRKF